MTTANPTVIQIANRHFADPEENGRSCRGCGRPWPCDVRRIVAALALESAPVRTASQSKGPRLRPAPAPALAPVAPALRPRVRRTPATRAISP